MTSFRLIPLLAAALSASPGVQASPAASPLRAAVAADSIRYAVLDPHRGLADCTPSAETLCRVRRPWTAAELRARVAADETAFRNGDQLTFVYRGQANGVEVGGGQLPPAPWSFRTPPRQRGAEGTGSEW